MESQPTKTRLYADAERGCSISIFRLPQPSKPKPERPFRARRPHRKSRNGCINCKARKVKCDETRPHCDRCRAHNIPCKYPQFNSNSSQETATVLAYRPSSICENASLGWRAVQSKVHAAARSGLRDSQVEHSTEQLARDELEALAQFTRMVALDEPYYPHLKKVFRDYAIPVALDEPCLLYAILAAGASHHTQAQPDAAQQSSISAARFRCTAIHLYRERLSRSIHKSDMDILLSSCILVGFFSFSLDRCDEENPSSSWVFNNDPSALNWLSVQGGLWSLLRVVRPWLNDSAWSSAFHVSSAHQATEDRRPGRADLHPGLADLCGIDETTTQETNAYHWPLRMLSPLLATPVPGSWGRDDVSRVTNFMGRLLPNYMALLRAREPRSLLILAYWLAVLSSVREWWIERRAMAECRAICMFLDGCGDVRVRRLLGFPAVVCGYW